MPSSRRVYMPLTTHFYPQSRWLQTGKWALWKVSEPLVKFMWTCLFTKSQLWFDEVSQGKKESCQISEVKIYSLMCHIFSLCGVWQAALCGCNFCCTGIFCNLTYLFFWACSVVLNWNHWGRSAHFGFGEISFYSFSRPGQRTGNEVRWNKRCPDSCFLLISGIHTLWLPKDLLESGCSSCEVYE